MSISHSHHTSHTVRDVIFALLRSFGMTTIFGNPGSTELPFFKDWPDDFRYILALQEASAVAMADAYAQATRNAAFVNLHSAAGLGHALGSVFTAHRNQAPLVLMAGQQTRSMLLTEPFLGARDATEFPRPYVKWSCEPALARDVPMAIARAYYLAMQKPCGPTFVSVPADDWDVLTEPVAARQVSFAFAPDPVALQQIADALNHSRKPALIVGPSVDRDGAWDAVVALAERTHSVVWESPKSSRASFPEDHPLFAGFLPPIRELLAQKLVGHDVVVVLGAPVFTYHVHTGGPFVPEGTQLFQMIDDPEAAARSAAGTSLLCTLHLGLTHLLELVEPSTRSAPAPRVRPTAPVATNQLSAEFFMHTLMRVMPTDAIIVEEAPTHENAMHDYLPIRKSGSFYTMASGGLGYGLPAAVGIALAHPERRVICLLGDGSTMYSVQGLWTAVQQHLPITFIVLNNHGYAALKDFGRMFGIAEIPGADLPGIDLVTIARGQGCASLRVEKAEELAETLTGSFASEGPVLIDVLVDPVTTPVY